jgi:flagellar biosynthesis/type III secretory pathway protein FliH
MSIRVRPKNAELRRVDDKETRNKKDEGWEDRLRLVGDARFVEVEWSKRDNPSWPLPIK